jgi:hypothetical protein
MASSGGCVNSVGVRLVEARVRPVAVIVLGKVSVTHGDRNKNMRDAFQISFFRARLCKSRPVNERAEAAVCKHGRRSCHRRAFTYQPTFFYRRCEKR